MSAIDEVLGEKVKRGEFVETSAPEKVKLSLDELIARQDEYHRSIQPVEVDVIVGEQQVKLFVPFVYPDVFSALADRNPPHRFGAADIPLWFDLEGVTSSYPGVTVVAGGEEDDLFRVRDKEAVYCWPDLYKVLSPEDRQSARMAVWALHVWEPEQQRKAAMAKSEGADNV